MEREASDDGGINLTLGIHEHLVFPISCEQRLKIPFMFFAELTPERFRVKNDRRYNLIRLREVVVQMDVPKTIRHPTPSIRLFLRKSVYIVRNLLMRDQHQMELELTTAAALLCKVLKHLGIA